MQLISLCEGTKNPERDRKNLPHTRLWKKKLKLQRFYQNSSYGYTHRFWPYVSNVDAIVLQHVAQIGGIRDFSVILQVIFACY